jgi:hypothetical protein
VFLSKEEVEKNLLRNMSFNGAKKSIVMDSVKLITTLRDTDVHNTKRCFTEVRCKLIVPEVMIDTDCTEEEEKEEDDYEEEEFSS